MNRQFQFHHYVLLHRYLWPVEISQLVTDMRCGLVAICGKWGWAFEILKLSAQVFSLLRRATFAKCQEAWRGSYAQREEGGPEFLAHKGSFKSVRLLRFVSNHCHLGSMVTAIDRTTWSDCAARMSFLYEKFALYSLEQLSLSLRIVSCQTAKPMPRGTACQAYVRGSRLLCECKELLHESAAFELRRPVVP